MSYKPLLDARKINFGFGQWLIIGIKVFYSGQLAIAKLAEGIARIRLLNSFGKLSSVGAVSGT